MKALIVGATGLIGSLFLEKILTDKQYTTIEIWVRKATGKSDPRFIEKLIDFDNIPGMPLIDADHVFCCLGTTIKKVKTKEAFVKIDHEYVVELARLASKSACQKFIVISSIGASKKSNNFYLRTKGEMEEDVKKLPFIATYILRPSMLLGKRNEFRTGEKAGKVLMAVLKFLMIGKLKKYRGIKASTVANAMLILAGQNDKGVFVFESDKIESLAD